MYACVIQYRRQPLSNCERYLAGVRSFVRTVGKAESSYRPSAAFVVFRLRLDKLTYLVLRGLQKAIGGAVSSFVKVPCSHLFMGFQMPHNWLMELLST